MFHLKEVTLFCRKFTELTEKYRDLLEKSNNLVVHKETTSGYESEIKRLETANSELTAHLEIEKEKLHKLEAAFENMRRQGKACTTTCVCIVQLKVTVYSAANCV